MVSSVTWYGVQARVIDGRILTPVDTAITWRRMCQGNVWMNFAQWLKFVEEIAEVRIKP